MTARHEQLFWWIYHYHRAKGFYPSQLEMIEGVSCSMTTLTRLLAQLEATGYIERAPGRWRNVRIIKMMGAQHEQTPIRP